MTASLGGLFLDAMVWSEWGFLIYLFILSSLYFFLVMVGLVEMLRHRATGGRVEDSGALNSSLLVPPVSVLAPAYNEAVTIRESVKALLALSYPEHEVIVINDGSTDQTLQLLIEEFHLYRSARYSGEGLKTKPVRAIYESMDPIRLIVVDKENGGKADALNAGINAAKYPLICSVDADSLLEQDALIRIARRFLLDPERVLAVGGIVRIANGCATASGRVIDVNLPRSWLARFQVVEYLRSFLFGRTGWHLLGGTLIVSGAFAIFHRATALETEIYFGRVGMRVVGAALARLPAGDGHIALPHLAEDFLDVFLGVENLLHPKVEYQHRAALHRFAAMMEAPESPRQARGWALRQTAINCASSTAV